MATTYETDIQQLYVTYFARPADPDGLKFWESVVEAAKGSTAAVAAAFAQSAEYRQVTANMDPYHVVNAIYDNLLGHDADLAGLNFWAQGLLKGSFTVDQAAAVIATGTQGSDQVVFRLKVAAASDFTHALDTPAKVLAYEGSGGIYWGRSYLAQVTPANPHPLFDEPVYTIDPIPSGAHGHGPTALAMPHPDAGAASVELIGIHLP